MSDLHPTERFSSRVENYVKFRPSYPPEVLQPLRDECGLTSDSAVADIGSGTGILASLFLNNGCTVYGVEPNAEMRQAGERLLQHQPRFHSVVGTAEAITLPDDIADFVVAGQAFHWFEPKPARIEFARILKPSGWCALIWNERRLSGTPFLEAYENWLLHYVAYYDQVQHRQVTDEVLAEWFAPCPMQKRTFSTSQAFDWEGLRGRALSSSYVPEAGHPDHLAAIAALSAIFEAHQAGGQVQFMYDTNVYFGQL